MATAFSFRLKNEWMYVRPGNIYQRPWKKNTWKALFGYLRDVFVFFFPIARLPKPLRLLLQGIDPDFIFLVHPRRKEDVFIAWPFALPMRLLLKQRFYSFIRCLPPTILGVIKTPSGTNGLIVSSTWLPEALIRNRKGALKEARKCLRFASKISRKGSCVGLGEWWPFITKRGEAVSKFSHRLGINITSGYSGTLCSIILSIRKIAQISDVSTRDLRVLILGVGKMGSSTAKALADEVGLLTVFDINRAKQIRLIDTLKSLNGSKQASIRGLEPQGRLAEVLSEHDVCICTTSNLRRIIKAEDLPDNILVLDDSRPEAFPRIYDKKREIIILEGGLLKIKGLATDFDFGFGNDANVFGCLAEAYILACAGSENIQPTIGDIDRGNFQRMFSTLERLGIGAPDFRSSHFIVDSNDIASLIIKKHPEFLLASTDVGLKKAQV